MRTLFFFCLLLGSSAWAQSCPSNHHIFLIHGIGGSAKTFGHLESVLNKSDPCYKTQSFEYDTGNSKLSTYDFAESFNQFVLKNIEAGIIHSQDKISLIMHSQGGLVGNIWLQKIKDSYPDLFSQVDGFITLSTPHWGAMIADVGKNFFYTLPPSMENPISPFGRTELNEMSYGSKTIRNLSSSIAKVFQRKSIRPLAIGGIHSESTKLYGENDAVVPLYSSRPDNLVAEYQISEGIPEEEIPKDLFRKSSNVPFVVVNATHLKLKSPGVADIPKECLSRCNHPSLRLIQDHLIGRSIASYEPKLEEFRVSIYLESHDVKLQILESKNITIEKLDQLKGYVGDAKLNDGLAFSFSGRTKKEGTQEIKALLSFKNGLKRNVVIPVEGGRSSILRLTSNP